MRSPEPSAERGVALVVACALLTIGTAVRAHPEGRRALASGSTEALAASLARSDGSTDDAQVAAILDALRGRGRAAAPAAETLSALLSHRSRLYADRDKPLVVRLRAYILVTLGEIGFPSSALPSLVDVLAHVDPRQTATEVGAAVRVVGSLGRSGCTLAPFLLDLLAEPLGEQEFSLERYEPEFPRREATTIQLEAVRALGRVCSRDEREVVSSLRALAGQGELDPRARREAREALTQVRARRGAAMTP